MLINQSKQESVKMSLNVFLPVLCGFLSYTPGAFCLLNTVNSQITEHGKTCTSGNTFLTAIRLSVFCSAHWCLRGSWPPTCQTAAPAKCLCMHQSILPPKEDALSWIQGRYSCSYCNHKEFGSLKKSGVRCPSTCNSTSSQSRNGDLRGTV